MVDLQPKQHPNVARTGGMQVGAHPCIGLQTVTRLFEGAILHHDSLGFVRESIPGQFDVMTAGEHGIAHSERTSSDVPGNLRGVQMWIASPTLDRPIAPSSGGRLRTGANPSW